jgi:hypothetical protein
VLCHNDVAWDNVIFREGRAAALIDFDFDAPGRPLWDVAQFARMCIPIDDDATAAQMGWEPSDKPARLRAIADAYGLDRFLRAALPGVMAPVDRSARGLRPPPDRSGRGQLHPRPRTTGRPRPLRPPPPLLDQRQYAFIRAPG